jgi:hypothetical protein
MWNRVSYKKYFSPIFLIVLCLVLPSAQATIEYDRLQPTPQRILYGSVNENLDLSYQTEFHILYSPDTEKDIGVFREQTQGYFAKSPTFTLSQRQKQHGRYSALIMTRTEWSGPTIWQEAPKQAQGYALEITSEGIALVGTDEDGFFYGLQTVIQLFNHVRVAKKPLPAAILVDWPDIPNRGVMMSVQSFRSNTDLKMFKTILTGLAGLKYNNIFLGFDSAVPGPESPFPQSVPNPLTESQIKEICEYAQKYHLTLNLAFQLGSHCVWLFREPAYADLREVQGEDLTWDEANWCPLNPKLWPIIRDLVQYQMKLCHPARVLVAHDEIYLGQYAVCPRCRKAGISKEKFIAQSLVHLREIIPPEQAEMMVWSDSFSSGLMGTTSELGYSQGIMDSEKLFALSPEKITLSIWDYSGSPGHIPVINSFRKHQRPYWVSTFQSQDVHKVCYYGQRYQAEGVLTTLWYEISQWNDLRSLSARGATSLVATAAYGWNVGSQPLHSEDPVQVFHDLVTGPSPISSDTTYQTVDLTKEMNFPQKDIGEVGSFTQVIESLPCGEIYGDSVPFQLKAKGILLAGDEAESKSLPTRKIISVNRPVRAIHFLHCCDVPSREAKLNDWYQATAKPQIGYYLLTFADGKTVKLPLEYRWNIQDWNSLEGAWESPLVLQGTLKHENTRLNVQRFSWRAQTGSMPLLKSIELVSDCQMGMNPMLLAMTLETDEQTDKINNQAQSFGKFENIAFADHFGYASSAALTDKWKGVLFPEQITALGRQPELVKDQSQPGQTAMQIVLPRTESKSRTTIGQTGLSLDLSTATTISMRIRVQPVKSGSFISFLYLGNSTGKYFYRIAVPLPEPGKDWQRIFIPMESAGLEGKVDPKVGLKKIDLLMISFFHHNPEPIHVEIDDFIIGEYVGPEMFNCVRQ